MTRMRKRVGLQAALAGMTIILTIIIIFAMSAAWYTNIAQTNSLIFEVDAWGNEGTVSSETQIVAAGPGDDGNVTLKITNESAYPASVCVNVTKARMSTEMQKRIYFYVDAETTRNEETVDRVYINSADIYIYNLFGHDTLVLEDKYYNDAQLKWQWVYDVLGYYVQGALSYDSNGKPYVVVTEYLRPIEYDYDSATMEFVEEDGNVTMEIETVDGEMTPGEFIVEFSKTDGYEGTINKDNYIETADGEIYYKVDVDENGSGVYAYLCSYTDIELATQYDTNLGLAAADAETPIKFEATVMVSVQNNNNVIVPVDSAESFLAEINSGEADVIQLSGDIQIGEALTIADDRKVIIDLNGYKLTSEVSSSAVTVQEGGSFTMVNGEFASDGSSNDYAIIAVGAELVLSDVDITGFKSGIRVEDSKGTGTDSSVRLVGCDMVTRSSALIIYGNGSDSPRDTQFIIDDCVIESQNGYGISGNGTVSNGGHYGTDIQILNSKIISRTEAVYAGIFHPQKDSKLTIYNSTISGYTGLVIKGGSVSVLCSTINGFGDQTIPTGFSQSGFIDTGDAVYIETNYEYDIDLTIGEDSVLHGENGFSLQVYDPEAENVTIKIYSGKIDHVSNDDLLESYIDKNSSFEIDIDGVYIITENTEEEEE